MSRQMTSGFPLGSRWGCAGVSTDRFFLKMRTGTRGLLRDFAWLSSFGDGQISGYVRILSALSADHRVDLARLDGSARDDDDDVDDGLEDEAPPSERRREPMDDDDERAGAQGLPD